MENEVIPEDVATFMGYFDMKVRFETSAGYILQGIRSSSR
jgi:hypothetical protein